MTMTPFLGGRGLLCRLPEKFSKNLRLILKLRDVEIGCLIWKIIEQNIFLNRPRKLILSLISIGVV